MREAANRYGVEPLITDDYLEVEAAVEALQPDLVLGSQMERHSASAVGVPCAVISPPAHILNFPLGYAPFIGYDGAKMGKATSAWMAECAAGRTDEG